MQKRNIFRIARVAANFSQSELARKVGSNQTEISFIENRLQKPTRTLARRLARVLDVDEEILFVGRPYAD
jgi:transcriptional regulator with XRE-family HTH domain